MIFPGRDVAQERVMKNLDSRNTLLRSSLQFGVVILLYS